eukprot:jgi/Chrzof1/11995/Cz06g17140.t1
MAETAQRHLVEVLRASLHPDHLYHSSIDSLEQDVMQRFHQILQERLKATDNVHPQQQLFSGSLPTLFERRPKPSTIRGLIQQEAKLRKLHSQTELFLEAGELKQIVERLEDYSEVVGDEHRINYDGFTLVATECLDEFGPQVAPYFQASTFLKFDRDGNGAISLPIFVEYISRNSQNLQLVS